MLKNLASRAGRALKSPTAKKIGIGLGALAVGGAVAYGVSKFRGRGTKRRSSVAKIKSQVQRLTLQVKREQLKRKLFKEQSKVI